MLAAGRALYGQTRQRKPERWSDDTRNQRNQDGIGLVWLNPETSEESETVESEDLAAWQFGQMH